MSKTTLAELEPTDLYDRDYYAWIHKQRRAFQEHRLEEIDWAKVAEEIEDLGKSQKHSVESQMARIAEHFLKLAYRSIRMKSLTRRVWELSVREARHQIRKA